MNDQGEMTNGTLVKGMMGSMAAIGASIVSALPWVETSLRLASLAVGLAVGLVTLYGLTRKIKSQRKDKEDESNN